MTVNTATGKITYTANGSTTEWTFPFPAIDGDFIEVFVTDTLGNIAQLPPSTYDVILNAPVDPNPTATGGKVIFPVIGAPLGAGNLLTIVRNLPAVQSTSIANQSIIYPPIIEQEFDYLTLLAQGEAEDFSRAFRVGISDPVPAIVPPVAARAGHNAFFDSLGNLTPGTIPGPGVFISAAMVPVVEAATLPLARQAMGISPIPFDVSAAFVVTPSNDRQVVNLTDGFYTVTIGPPSGFLSSFWTFLYNTSTRGKSITVDGFPAFILWPGQFVWVFNTSSGWAPTNPGRWVPRVPVNFYVNPVLGNDGNDGLATGAGAFQTIGFAVATLEGHCDGDFTINLADGTYNVGDGIICRQSLPGARFGYNIIGNIANPNNVVVSASTVGNFVWTVTNNAVVTLRGFRFFGVNGGGLSVRLGGTATIGNVIFGQISTNVSYGYHMECRSGGTLFVDAPYHITGAAALHINCVSNGTIIYTPGTITIDNAVSFDTFLVCSVVAAIYTRATFQNFVNPAFVSGIKYNLSYNAVASMGGTTMPGDIAGSATNGGIFA